MKLQVIDSEVNYWVVRPGEDAKFFQHFKHNGIIALGHIDNLANENGIIEEVESVKVSNALHEYKNKKKEANKKPDDEPETDEDKQKQISQIASAVTQVNTFINDIKVGDIVISLNQKNVLLGTVTTPAYIEKEELRGLKPDGTFLERKLSYKLRRKIVWERERNRRTIPTPIKPSFSANQTIFSIKKNKELFTHWLYSAFQQKDRLHFSTKIDERDKISQFNLTEFQRTIQKLELIAERIAHNDLDFSQNIEEQYIYSGIHNEFTLTTKNSFLSEGNIWSEVQGNPKKLAIFAILLGSLFNTPIVASDDIKLSEEQKEAMEVAVKSLKKTGEGNFDVFRKGIQASLDQPNKSSSEVKPAKLDNMNKIVFPKIKKEGDTGV
jgi:hypothetical protein